MLTPYAFFELYVLASDLPRFLSSSTRRIEYALAFGLHEVTSSTRHIGHLALNRIARLHCERSRLERLPSSQRRVGLAALAQRPLGHSIPANASFLRCGVSPPPPRDAVRFVANVPPSVPASNGQRPKKGQAISANNRNWHHRII